MISLEQREALEMIEWNLETVFDEEIKEEIIQEELLKKWSLEL